ncbi:arylacetamide deacetylase-like 4 [Tiliqua scincoides]|uniref:arylacetamide deacetylase-like 4 n=1 Tax=Tiliqua scincoides TaxID=71010 RepID=UPI0034618E66
MLTDGIPPIEDSRLSIKNVYFEGVPVRIYHPRRPSSGKQKGLLFFHGGSGTVGSLDAYERVCRHFSLMCNVVVVSVGYRLAPEHRFPAQFEDGLKAVEFFMKNAESHGVDPARIVISGDGFGATIAAYIVQELVKRTDLPKPHAQVLIGPFLQAVDFNLLSYQQNRFVPIVSQRDMIQILFWYATSNKSLVDLGTQELHIPEDKKSMYKKWLSPDNIPKELLMRGLYREFQPSTDPSDNIYFLLSMLTATLCSPLSAEDAVICQLPETFILTCEFDVLRDDGLLYKKRLEDHGVRVSWCHSTDGFHGLLYLFNLWYLAFPFSKKGVDNIVNYIKSL